MERNNVRGAQGQNQDEKAGRAPDVSTIPVENGAKAEPSVQSTAHTAPLANSFTTDAATMDTADKVSLSVEHLSVHIDDSPGRLAKLLRKEHNSRPKAILNDISLRAESGALTAILGGSGSGKTTLLNQLSGRTGQGRLITSGKVLFNGIEDFSGVKAAYVIQEDILQPTLTIRETLTYAAKLRLPASVSDAEKQQKVEEIMKELGLSEVADTKIGNHRHRGCSGGEKRRTSIGVQLLSNPSILYLDEPTTGLDSTNAFQVIKTLQGLARKGRTVVVTIHQPRSEIWSLFDNVVLLTKGITAYAGGADTCLEYFSKLGYTVGPFINPAEYLLDIISVDNRTPEAEEASLERVNGIERAWREHSSKDMESTEKPVVEVLDSSGEHPVKKSSQYTTTTTQQIRVLTSRTWKVMIRDPIGTLGSLIAATGLAVLSGLIFLQLNESLAGIHNRQGALYIGVTMQGYLVMLYEVYKLSQDIRLFDEESRQGIVSVPAFLISRRLTKLPVEDLPAPLIFSVIFYFMVGFRTEANQFFIFFAIMLLVQYTAIGLATIGVALARDFASASAICNIIFTLQSLAGGYFIQAKSIPVYVRWIKWTGYIFYAFGALCTNEFAGHLYDCPDPDGAESPECVQYTGQFILRSLGLPSAWLWRPILALLGFALAFHLGSGLLLTANKPEIGVSKARPSPIHESVANTTTRKAPDARTVSVRLQQYRLDVHKRGLKAVSVKPILHSITAEFLPGMLNVILGPSGSGKTSLLNAIAGRLKSNITTTYQADGTVTFNGLSPSKEVIDSICSLVQQDDNALSAHLTVRETLRFAASLRLPKWMSKGEAYQRAEDIMIKMGLKDCADNLIGDDSTKGTSGGEKRRVSIAIQILTEPRVLVLDEPLSGLDAFTAVSVVEVLNQLAMEGRTIIMTVHQPRSDLFPQFGYILLLASGGYPIYAGRGFDMVPNLASRGFECAEHVNPADFALDLATVILQSEAKRAATRETVQLLSDSWVSSDRLESPSGTISTPAELGSLARERAGFFRAFPIVLHRAGISFFRQPNLVIGRISQVISIGLLLSLFFAPLKSDYIAIQNRLGFLIQVSPLFFVGMLQNIAVYPLERDIFYHDFDDRVYGVEAFILTYTTLEFPFEIISSLVFSVLACFAVGLRRSASMFLIVAFNSFCILSCGESMGIAFNTFFSHTGFSLQIMSVLLSIAQIMAGIISVNIPAFLQAFNHLSPLKYSVANLAPWSFQGIRFTCKEWQQLPDGTCPLSTGEEVLDLYNLNTNPHLNIAALAVCTVVYRIIAYLVLKIAKERWLGIAWRKLR